MSVHLIDLLWGIEGTLYIGRIVNQLPLHIKYDTLFYTQHPLLESNSNIKFVI